MHIGRRRKWIAAVLIGAFCLSFLLFGVRFNLPGQLETAGAKWEAQHIENYRYRVQFASFSWVGSVFITVSDGQVTKIEQDQTNPLYSPRPDPPVVTPIPANSDWYMRNFSPFLPSDLSLYSVDSLLDFATQIQHDHPRPILAVCEPVAQMRYEVSYNPDRGYVEGLRFTNCATWDFGAGLMCGMMSDCSSGFRITDFEALPDV
ncbi:MAG: DUF6174 domain-containing protein [Chloroflexota bacterium]